MTINLKNTTKVIKRLIPFILLSQHGIGQNVGINNGSPQFPLSFNADLGDKISLWADGTGTHYGLGVQSGLLQLFAKTPGDNIAFGYGSSNAFTERMRIVNSGEFGMELDGRLLLKNSSQDPSYSPGIWLNKSDNSSMLAFMGTRDNQNIGFYGGPEGWGFTYDAINSRVGIGNTSPNAPLSFAPSLGKKITLYPGGSGDAGLGMSGNRLQIYSDNPNADVAIGYDAAGTFNERFAVKPTGALAVNGNIGSAGQVLQSNGNNAATWVSTTNQLFNNIYTFGLTSAVLTTGNFIVYGLPGLDQDITLTQTSKVLISIHAAGYNNGCFGCGNAYMEFRLSIDNSPNFFQYKSTASANGEAFDQDSGLRVATLGPGLHNFKMFARHNSGGDINVYADGVNAYGTRMTIIVVPQ